MMAYWVGVLLVTGTMMAMFVLAAIAAARAIVFVARSIASWGTRP